MACLLARTGSNRIKVCCELSASIKIYLDINEFCIDSYRSIWIYIDLYELIKVDWLRLIHMCSQMNIYGFEMFTSLVRPTRGLQALLFVRKQSPIVGPCGNCHVVFYDFSMNGFCDPPRKHAPSNNVFEQYQELQISQGFDW